MKLAVVTTDERFGRAVDMLAGTLGHISYRCSSPGEIDADVFILDVGTLDLGGPGMWPAEPSRTVAYLPADDVGRNPIAAAVAHAPDRGSLLDSLPEILAAYMDGAAIIAETTPAGGQ